MMRENAPGCHSCVRSWERKSDTLNDGGGGRAVTVYSVFSFSNFCCRFDQFCHFSLVWVLFLNPIVEDYMSRRSRRN